MRLPLLSRGALVVAASIAVAHASGMLPTAAAAQGGPVLVIKGHGFGHGVGMPQDGALSMGRKGSSTADILNKFYPGSTTGTASGPVRVLLLVTATREVSLGFPDGGTVAGDRSIRVAPGQNLKLGWADGSYWVEDSATASTTTTTTDTTEPDAEPTSTTALISAPVAQSQQEPTTTTATTEPEPPTTTSTAPPPQPRVTSTAPWRVSSEGTIGVGQLGRRYRGFLDVRIDEQQSLRLVNQLDVEAYLKGMGEVRNPSWPPASLRAQAVAARTYAMRAMAAAGELCPDQRCQVYLGAQAEYAAMNKAVSDTAGQVLRHGGNLASTVYSANGGGHTATREEGFGTTSAGYPYLVAVPYETSDTSPWTLRVSFADIGSRLNYQGTVTKVTISKVGPSKRALQVLLEGSTGVQAVTGRTFDARIGLKSTLFSFEVEQGSAPPLATAPGAGSLLQVVPEDIADLVPLPLPPRPPDPPLPPSLMRPTTTADRVDDVAAPALLRLQRDESSNVPLAVFMILVLASAAGAAVLIRRGS